MDNPTYGSALASVWHFGLLSLILWIILPSVVLSQTSQDAQLDHWHKLLYGRNQQVSDSARMVAGILLMERYILRSPDTLRQISNTFKSESKRLGDWRWLAHAEQKLGKFHEMHQAMDSARYYYQAALDHIKDESAPIKALTYSTLGRFYGKQNELDSASHYLLLAISLGKKYHLFEQGFLSTSVYGNLAVCYEIRGKYIDAMSLHLIASNYGIPNVQFTSHMQVGKLFLKIGLEEEAKVHFKIALQKAEELQAGMKLIKIYLPLVELADSLEEVEAYLTKASEIADSPVKKTFFMDMLLSATTRYLDSLQLGPAEQYYQQSMALAGESGDKSNDNYLMLLSARINHYKTNFTTSLRQCRQLLSVLSANDDRAALKALYRLYAQNFEAIGRPDSALYYYQQQQVIIEELNDPKVTKNIIKEYLEFKTGQELKQLEDEKKHAEQEANEALAKTRQSYLLVALIMLVLTTVVLIYHILFRQKRKNAVILEREKRRLQSANEKLRRFSRVISHDILSNLDLVLSTGNILVGSERDPNRLSQYYEMTQNTSHQLKKYCLNLLEEAQRDKQANVEVCDPMPIIHQVLSRMQLTLRAKNFEVELGELSPTTLTAVLVEQLFQNLVSNAIRYAATGPHPLLRIFEENRQGYIHWIIEDRGPGIQVDRRAQIFVSHSLAPKSSKGQHLGLSMIHSMLREIGGDIWVEDSPEGEGARFIVQVPSNKIKSAAG